MIGAKGSRSWLVPLGAVAFIVACQSSGPAEPAGCATGGVYVGCALQRAERLLVQVEGDPFAWTSGAGELAVALDAIGDTPAAIALLKRVESRWTQVEDSSQRAAAASEYLASLTALGRRSAAPELFREPYPETFFAGAKSADLRGKRLLAAAARGDESVLEAALSLPEQESFEADSKAVTLYKLVSILAEAGDFEGAERALRAITMSITYYQAMARSDLALLAWRAGRQELAGSLLVEADTVARTQDSGYFLGAALRDLGFVCSAMGEAARASRYFGEAAAAAATAEKENESARATSRIATRLADAGRFDDALDLLLVAQGMAEGVEDSTLRGYSLYEVAGSAAFAGEFELATDLIEQVPDVPLGSTTSIRSAAQRDLAWGLARFGLLEEAFAESERIGSPRERIQAYSRIVRLLVNPEIEALPRYL